jgi:hypothetical protein
LPDYYLEEDMMRINQSQKQTQTLIQNQVLNWNIRRFQNFNDYALEKMTLDPFVINALTGMMNGLRRYLSQPENFRRLNKQKDIVLIDIGPAHGALASLFALSVLEEFGLMDKTSLKLVDPVAEVLTETIKIKFDFKHIILPIYLLSKLPQIKRYPWSYSDWISRVESKIRSAASINKGIEDSTILVEFGNNVDLGLVSFTFHHIEQAAKNKAVDNILCAMKIGGFIGIADEWFEDEYRERFLVKHKEDQIPFEFPEPIEILLERFHDEMTVHEARYDGQEAFFIVGAKKRLYEIERTQHRPYGHEKTR